MILEEMSRSMVSRDWRLTGGAATGGMVTVMRALPGVSISLTLTEDGDYIRLHRLRAMPAGADGGRAALRDVCACADETGVRLTLLVRPFGGSPMGEAALARLYEEFGFEPDLYADAVGSMIRHPGPAPSGIQP